MNAFNRALNMKNVSAMDNATLFKNAPSVFAEFAHDSLSSRYTQIPTIKIVDSLRNEGWMPVAADESKTRDTNRKGFAKHLLRFRHIDNIGRTLNVNDKFQEICLLNSHDGSSSYQLHAGIFRLACSNGMIVADSTLQKQAVRHSGDIIGNVIEGVYSIVEDLPRVEAQIEQFKNLILTRDEQRALAKSGLALRWEENAPVQPESLLSVKRADDRTDDLWTVFNRIQENMIKGGLSGYTRDSLGRPKRTTTREVRSVTENVRLNKALWTLADEMAKLKA